MTVVTPLELVHPVVAGRALLRGADGSLLRGHRPGREPRRDPLPVPRRDG